MCNPQCMRASSLFGLLLGDEGSDRALLGYPGICTDQEKWEVLFRVYRCFGFK